MVTIGRGSGASTSHQVSEDAPRRDLPRRQEAGRRNEIQIASETAKKLGDDSFIIPLRLEPFEAPFLAVQHQWIDFRDGWGSGLAELLDTLDTIGGLFKTDGLNAESMARWLAAQSSKTAMLDSTPEVLVSSWLPIVQLPITVRYFSFLGSASEEQIAASTRNFTVSHYPYARGFFGFGGTKDYAGTPGAATPRLTHEIPLDDFLERGFHDFNIQSREAKNVVSVLIRTAFEKLLQQKGLATYSYSGHSLAFWVHSGIAPGTQPITFDWNNGWKGRRNLAGQITRGGGKKIHWHYGVSPYVRLGDEPYIQLTPRLIFSDNGREPITSAAKMHSLRRSVPKSWRNDRWRDLVLSFLFWLSDGKTQIEIPLGENRTLRLGAMPITMQVPASITSANDTADQTHLEEDDPVFRSEPDDESPDDEK
ncbi:hypothetical protein AUC68_09315 [Methyloceanibacter methanicus]|uniref:Uncharacterized protein n=1 Tax=Methyloceanibacter methanicus TaxID=1774968 RepID=A0A1E3VYH7_9HYPH|nr:toll/interleukin-1 receptor domain-containing protein [Methyloceanibacter methanicus]ODR98594.1 hypothetical protein AUC68_09315 [Methyloceanibacter methanicus]